MDRWAGRYMRNLIAYTFAMAVGLGASESNAATNILENAGFESGVLSPWTVESGDPTVTNIESHSGNYSVALSATDTIEQTFGPIDDDEIKEISFWVDIPVTPQRINRFTFFYNNGTQYTSDVYGYNEGWTYLNITNSLDPKEQLVGFLIYGTSTGGSTTPAYLDDFVIATPEPSTWAMMALGFAGLGFVGWRGSRKSAAHAA
jgi:hypothetical protein